MRNNRSHVAKLTKLTQDTFTHEFFIESSKHWQNNKIKLLNCTYKYSCNHVSVSGEKCGKQDEHSHVQTHAQSKASNNFFLK